MNILRGFYLQERDIKILKLTLRYFKVGVLYLKAVSLWTYKQTPCGVLRMNGSGQFGKMCKKILVPETLFIKTFKLC